MRDRLAKAKTSTVGKCRLPWTAACGRRERDVGGVLPAQIFDILRGDTALLREGHATDCSEDLARWPTIAGNLPLASRCSLPEATGTDRTGRPLPCRIFIVKPV